jgi:predicted NACHT family NTPase
MALNPLLLTMIATVHCFRGALPGRRVELYGEICDVLLGRRQEAKGIPDSLTAEQKKAVLQVLALELMKHNTRNFPPKAGSYLIENKLATVTSNITAKDFLINIKNTSGILLEKEANKYEFAHKSFQEYLAAVEIQKSNQEHILAANINNAWWDETIRLYAAQRDATNLIRAALDQPTVVSLKLALDCQEEGLAVEEKVRKQLTDKIDAGLESNEAEIFKLAAEVQLARRLSNFLRIDEDLEIDNSYITFAEYQLYLDSQSNNQNRIFSPGNAKKTISGVNFTEQLVGWVERSETQQNPCFCWV